MVSLPNIPIYLLTFTYLVPTYLSIHPPTHPLIYLYHLPTQCSKKENMQKRHVNEDDNILRFNINIVFSKHFNIMGVNEN